MNFTHTDGFLESFNKEICAKTAGKVPRCLSNMNMDNRVLLFSIDIIKGEYSVIEN